jgi:hypothetical protein
MTEPEWLSCNDPGSMLNVIQDMASKRKLRLFAVACCRRIWPLLADERSRQGVEASELHVEGALDYLSLHTAAQKAWDAARETRAPPFAGYRAQELARGLVASHASTAAAAAAWCHDLTDVRKASELSALARQGVDWSGGRNAEFVAQCDLIRCVFGNPFRTIPFDSAWISSTARQVAQAIYDDRDFDRMPILADALEDAGCTSEEVLAHCRGESPHVSGCWVVDWILGKK